MEKIEFRILGENADKQVILFQNYIQKSGIEQLESIEIVRVESHEGEMGAGKFVNALNAFVGEIKTSIVQVLKSSFSFSLKFRSDMLLIFNEVELKIEYSPKNEASDEMFKRLEALILETMAKQVNTTIVCGNGNIVLQDVNGSTVSIKKE